MIEFGSLLQAAATMIAFTWLVRMILSRCRRVERKADDLLEKLNGL